jgi:hypothetical protein
MLTHSHNLLSDNDIGKSSKHATPKRACTIRNMDGQHSDCPGIRPISDAGRSSAGMAGIVIYFQLMERRSCGTSSKAKKWEGIWPIDILAAYRYLQRPS